MQVEKGKIAGFRGSWGSGLGYLEIEDDSGLIQVIPCENAPTVRALEDAFGNVITSGHTANGKGCPGKVIYYSVSAWGVLEGFTPAE